MADSEEVNATLVDSISVAFISKIRPGNQLLFFTALHLLVTLETQTTTLQMKARGATRDHTKVRRLQQRLLFWFVVCKNTLSKMPRF